MNLSDDRPKPGATVRPPAAAQPATYRHQRYLQGQLRRGAAMAPDRAVTADHVRDVILKDLDRRTGRSGAWEVEPVLKARESWLFKASTPLAPWPLAIKVYCDAVAERVAVRQLKVIQRYHAAMASRPAFAVPTPWAALPEHRTLIMEWIDATRVDKLLKRAGHTAERDQVIAAAARWLRHFHDQGDQSVRPLKSIDLLRHLDTLLGGDGAGATVRDPVFRSAYRVLQDSLHTLADAEIPFVISHGDFKPGNLFHGPERTVGFDFNADKARPPAMDIVHFLVYTSCFCTGRWVLRTSQVDQHDQDVFLAAYGPPNAPMDDHLLAVFRLVETLTGWAHLRYRMSREGVNFRRLARAWRLRGIAKRTAGTLKRAC